MTRPNRYPPEILNSYLVITSDRYLQSVHLGIYVPHCGRRGEHGHELLARTAIGLPKGVLKTSAVWVPGASSPSWDSASFANDPSLAIVDTLGAGGGTRLDEDAAGFQQIAEALWAYWQPVGAQEEVLVEQVVQTVWRLRRLGRAEAGVFALECCSVSGEHIAEALTILLGHAFTRGLQNSFAFPTLSRRPDTRPG